MEIRTLFPAGRAAATLVAFTGALALGGFAPAPDDDGSRVCAGTMKTVVCVPPEELPEA